MRQRRAHDGLTSETKETHASLQVFFTKAVTLCDKLSVSMSMPHEFIRILYLLYDCGGDAISRNGIYAEYSARC